METCHLSALLYDMMLKLAGSEEKVTMKRTEMDVCDYLHNQMTPFSIQKRTVGSFKEGLRLQGSDMDAFYFWSDHRVILDLADAPSYDHATEAVILMEYQEHIPGTVYLRVLYMHPINKIMTSCIQKKFHTYVSNKLFLENVKRIYHGHNVTIHGPCQTNKVLDHEFDSVYGFVSRKWPQQTSDWIARCLKYGWPKKQIVESITSSGCDFVPVGSRQSRQNNDPNLDLEWRLSFVQAEQALVRAMNHVQLLCYVSLKVFLTDFKKDVVEDEKLLCSYFLKNAMFWCIQTDPTYKWTRETFFQSFWKCFKLLLQWIYTGYCPNFFIPQNNLFVCRIVGANQDKLFTQMYSIYCSGEKYLAQCSSLQKVMNPLANPLPWEFSEYKKDIAIYHSMYGINGLLNLEIIYDWKSLYKICRMDVSKMSNIEQILIFRHVINLYHQIALVEQSCCTCKTKCSRNRHTYVTHKKVGVRLLKLTSKFGFACDPLYLALFYYIDGRFRQSLNILEDTMPKLNHEYFFYWHEYGNEQAYAREMFGKPMSVKMKAAMVYDISILLSIKLSELEMEMSTNKKSKLRRCFLISPFVFLHFLTFLCHHRLGSPLAARSLWELHNLVHSNNSRYIIKYSKDIAWDILGICHHLSGNIDQSLLAYYTSLLQPNFHFITEAVKTKILLLQIELQSKGAGWLGPFLDYINIYIWNFPFTGIT